MPLRDLSWQSIIDAVTHGVVMFDGNDALAAFNDAFVALLGTCRSEVRLAPPPWSDAAAVATACAAARRDGSAHVAVQLTPRHGEPVPATIALRALPRYEGWVVGTVRDDRAPRKTI